MASSNTFLVRDVRIFDGFDFIESGFVFIDNGRIGQFGAGDAPESLSASYHGNMQSVEQSLFFGITTVMDQHNERESFEKLGKLTSNPANLGKYSDFKYCGYCATIEGGWPENVITLHDKSEKTRALIDTWPKLRTKADIAPFVQQQKASGASWIKLMHETGAALAIDVIHLSKEMRVECIQQAHAHGMKIVAHALAHDGTCDVLSEDIDGLTHCFLDSFGEDLKFVELYKATGAHCNPTLAAVGSLTAEGRELQTKFTQDPLVARLGLTVEQRQSHCRCMSMANERASVQNAYAAMRELYKAGVPIIVGSDAAGPALGTTYGLSHHQEMYLLAHAVGMAPTDVLRAATSTISDRFGFSDRGSIKSGRKADLCLITGDPRQHFKQENKYCLPIAGVWREGIVADAWKEEVSKLET